MTGMNIIFQRIVSRERAKGLNFTIDDLNKSPLEHQHLVSVLFLTALVVSCITGLIGNTLVIGAVMISKKLRTTGNMFIVNLAIADFIVILIVEPFNYIGIINGAGPYIENVWLCHFVAIICVMACVCSMMNLAAVAVNRYIMINKFQLYKRIFTKRKTILMCTSLWFIAFLIELPNLTGWGGHTFDLKTLGCSFDRLISLSYTIFLSVTALYIPLSLILFCYVKIYLYVRQSRRHIAMSVKCKTRNKKGRKDEVRLARTFFIVFISFLICWTPYDLTLFLDRSDKWPSWLYILFMQVGHFNSSVNSILYGLTNRHFREGYKQFLSKFIPGFHTVFIAEHRKSTQITSETSVSLREDQKL
ncbi:melatonin receptor type 1B-A-like [Mytilus edulis]|uniref:melatonin receptor type 1B-A-like n=1 Tax=Mytilus edulis TaxID=6550 RepID=UPI0039EE79A1